MRSAPLSKTQYVIACLREDMASGAISPGSQLIQLELAERYGVSATPIREALRVLESEGTVVYSPHRVSTVRELPDVMVEDIYRLRSVVESFATRVAVERMTPEALEVILNAYDDLNQADPSDSSLKSSLNKRLHFTIYRAGSDFVYDHANSLWVHFPPNVTIWSDKASAGSLAHDHEHIIEAIKRGDAETAANAMSAHILHAFELRRTL